MAQNISLIPELQEYCRQVEAIKQDAHELMDGVTKTQFNWRSGADRWSIAECLEHLNITARLYFPVINEMITQALLHGWRSQGPFRHGWFGNFFVRSVEPPPGMRFKAPRRFVPPPDRPLSEVWSEFIAFQDRLIELIGRANGVDLARVKVQIPATNLIKLSLGQSFRLVAAHERRHLWQARQVKADPGFPR
jgi:hypothetical protein